MSDVRDRMQQTAQAIQANLPPKTVFILLAFGLEYSDPANPKTEVIEYISNGDRDDAINLMEQFINRIRAGDQAEVP